MFYLVYNYIHRLYRYNTGNNKLWVGINLKKKKKMGPLGPTRGSALKISLVQEHFFTKKIIYVKLQFIQPLKKSGVAELSYHPV